MAARVIGVNVHVSWHGVPDPKSLLVEIGDFDRSVGRTIQWEIGWAQCRKPDGTSDTEAHYIGGAREDPSVLVGYPVDPSFPPTENTWVTIGSRGDGATPAGLRRIARMLADVAVLLSDLMPVHQHAAAASGGHAILKKQRVFSPEGAAAMLRVIHYVVRRLDDPGFLLLARRSGRIVKNDDQELHVIAEGGASANGVAGRTDTRLMHGAFFGPLVQSEWSTGSPYMTAAERFAVEIIAHAMSEPYVVNTETLEMQKRPHREELLRRAEDTLGFLGIDRLNCRQPNAEAIVEQYLHFVATAPLPPPAAAADDVDSGDDQQQEPSVQQLLPKFHATNAEEVHKAYHLLVNSHLAACAEHEAYLPQDGVHDLLRHECVPIRWTPAGAADGPYNFVLTLVVFTNVCGNELASRYAQTALAPLQHPAFFSYATLEDHELVTPEYIAEVEADGRRCFEMYDPSLLSDYDRSISCLDFYGEARRAKELLTPGVAPPNLLAFAFIDRTCDVDVDDKATAYMTKSTFRVGSIMSQKANPASSTPDDTAELFTQRQLFASYFNRCLWRAIQALAEGASEGLFESDETVFHFGTVRFDPATQPMSYVPQHSGGSGAGASAPTVEYMWEQEDFLDRPYARMATYKPGACPTMRQAEIFCLYAYDPDATSSASLTNAQKSTQWLASNFMSQMVGDHQ